MDINFTKSEKAIIIGLYLSKFNKDGLTHLGFSGFWEAFNALGYCIGVKPATVKNYRDEFDPYFPNNRKGWHNRSIKTYCKPILDNFSTLPLSEFTQLIKSIIYFVPSDDEIITGKSESTTSVANRLITGLAAEQYFKDNYESISFFQHNTLKHTTFLGCRYDLELYLSGMKQYCVELKALAGKTGNITLTEKEYLVAEKMKDKYCLFIVKNFKEKPDHFCVFNPINSHFNFKKTERQIIQINYSFYI